MAAGTSDSILVFLELPYAGADPDTVDILGAMRNRQVFGRPEVGDNVAIVRCDSMPSVATIVIDTEKLTDEWCYDVLPSLRRRMVHPDSLPQRLREMLLEPRQYSLVLKDGGMAFATGSRPMPQDEQSPLVYPQAKNYGQWAIFNGRLVLSEVRRDSTGTTVVGTDTASFVRLRRDTLVLRFRDGERTYHKKQEAE